MSYPFLYKGDFDNSYGFETIIGIQYNIKFKPSAYLLGDESTPFASHIFEFVIELIYNPLDRNPPLDKLMSDTIAAIMIDFIIEKTSRFVFIFANRVMESKV